MTQTLVCQRLKVQSLKAASNRGFTLLEMMVVLAIVGLAAALVAPRVFRSVDAVTDGLATAAVADQLRQLPRRVRLLGRELDVTNASLQVKLVDGELPLELQPELRVTVTKPFSIAGSGVCTAGALVLSRVATDGEGVAPAPAPSGSAADANVTPPGAVLAGYEVSAPLCEVKLIDAPQT
jgi:general secretion pathway protein G